MRRHTLLLTSLLFALAIAPRVRADATSDGVADALFAEGSKLMEEGKSIEACPKLAESHRIRPGGGSALNLAICYRNIGKTASALNKFREARSFALKDGKSDRLGFANAGIAELEPIVSYLTVRVAPAAEVEGLVVKVDDQTFEKPTWGVAVPVDPGSRVVSAVAPGKKRWESKVEIGAKSDKKEIEVPPLENEPVAVPVPQPPDDKKKLDAPIDGHGATSGYVIGSIGVVAVGVGAIFGISAITADRKVDAACEGKTVCDGDNADLSKRAVRDSWISTGFIAAGLVGVGIGTYIVLTSKPADGSTGSNASTMTMRLEVRPSFFGLSGAF